MEGGENRNKDTDSRLDTKFDDTIYCKICGQALRYDRDNREWRTKFIEESPLIRTKCYDRHNVRWDHEPKKNVGRLVRAVKRMLDKERMGI